MIIKYKGREFNAFQIVNKRIICYDENNVKFTPIHFTKVEIYLNIFDAFVNLEEAINDGFVNITDEIREIEPMVTL